MSKLETIVCKQSVKTEVCEKLAKLPLQYNQMAVTGIMVLDEIEVDYFIEFLKKSLGEDDFKVFIKYRTREGHGSFILKRMTDKEIAT